MQKSANEKARRAAYRLFGAECAKCHQLDLEADPVTVEPPAIVQRWFPHGRFVHDEDHVGARGDGSCVQCHGGAEASAVTADVLLPDIENCAGAGCHQGEAVVQRAAGEVVASDCRQCHGYHGSAARAETPLTPRAVAATLEALQRLQESSSGGRSP